MTGHTHDMRLDSPPGPVEVYKCSSCLFACTKRSLAQVRANPGQHQLVRKGHPQASLIWDGPKPRGSST